MEGKFLKRLKDQSHFPIGINEILNSGQSIIDCANKDIGDIFVLDIFECGGLRNLLNISKFLELSGYQVMCRAHGSPSISYLASLGVISCTNSNSISTPMQIYDFDTESNYLKWKPSISNGIMKICNKDLDFELDETKFKRFLKIYRTGKKYHIYSNKKRELHLFFQNTKMLNKETKISRHGTFISKIKIDHENILNELSLICKTYIKNNLSNLNNEEKKILDNINLSIETKNVSKSLNLAKKNLKNSFSFSDQEIQWLSKHEKKRLD